MLVALIACEKEHEIINEIEQNQTEETMGKLVTLPPWKYDASAWSPIGTASKKGNNQVEFSGLTTTQIKNVLGESSHAVGVLCKSTKVNKWSGCQPGTWLGSSATGDPNGAKNISYVAKTAPPYQESSYAGYNHNATKPQIISGNGNDIIYGQTGQTTVTVKYRMPDFTMSHLGCTHMFLYDGAFGDSQQVAAVDLSADTPGGRDLSISGAWSHGSITAGYFTQRFYVYFGTPQEPTKYFIQSTADSINRYIDITFNVRYQKVNYYTGNYGWTPPPGMNYNMTMLNDSDKVGTQKIKFQWLPTVGSGPDAVVQSGTYDIYRATSSSGANLTTIKTGVVVSAGTDVLSRIVTESSLSLTNTAGVNYWILFKKR